MNYRIVGQDGKIYGPATEEQIRAWLGQGRLDSRTPVFVEGAGDWTFIGLLPEFSPQASAPKLGSLKPDLTLAHKTNGFATTGFVLGLLSCCGCGCCCFPISLLGVVFSIIGMVQIKSNSPPQNGWGLALAGLICSIAGLVVGLLLGLANAITNPANASWNFNWN